MKLQSIIRGHYIFIVTNWGSCLYWVKTGDYVIDCRACSTSIIRGFGNARMSNPFWPNFDHFHALFGKIGQIIGWFLLLYPPPPPPNLVPRLVSPEFTTVYEAKSMSKQHDLIMMTR